ncbi:bis(5'-nucleosyl)-tetraphosphatase (symmetrical) YqeK [Ruminococcaceae bacterium OttesenSCG-928-N02]|nr:bis(5'-nucleosyl)-tetraphosphatase (symmetrical) YqeK [Ruminococcaceae bacterium OttesenSCG-928-N02]
MNITAAQCEKLAQNMLSEKRFHHVQCVREQAVLLAEQYGADKNKAEIAALLHDITKELPTDENLQWLMHGGIIKELQTDLNEKLWHSYTGAFYAREELGLQDEETLNAIFYHTTARASMTLLEKVIYMADKTSPERCYAGVQELRTLLNEGELDRALYKALTQQTQRLIEKGATPHPDTIAAMAELEAALQRGV